MKKTLAQRRSDWENNIKQWKESGLSQATYCRTHKLSSSQFSYWKQKLNESPESSSVGSVSAGFIPISVVDNLPGSSKELSMTLPNGCQLKGINQQTVAVAQVLLKACLL